MENQIKTHQKLQDFLTSVIKPHAEITSKLRVCNENDFMQMREIEAMDESNSFERMSEFMNIYH